MVGEARGRGRAPTAAFCALALAVLASLGGCSDRTPSAEGPVPGEPTASAGPARTERPTSITATSYAVEPPGPLEGSLLRPDVLITGSDTLSHDLVRAVRSIPGVEAALPISLASASIEGRTLSVAAVDAGQFRRFTESQVAQDDRVWDRVAGGEVAVDPDVSKKLIGKGDMLRLSTRPGIPPVHVGAYAPLIHRDLNGPDERPAIQALVNAKRGDQLGIPVDNAMLVATGAYTPSRLAKQFQAVLRDRATGDSASGDRATMQILALELDVDAPQTAVLTGGSVSAAVGRFSYTNRPNGEISPDPAWVRQYIRREEVPLLGAVTCNKAMLPQLRAALQEIVRVGLADKIHPDEYAGCYYPRYINRDPSNGLSLHSWGIAVDLNVHGNQRGTVGEMNRTVVEVFKRWGFAWGGDWNYTDPMHFEMNSVVRTGG